ncbi:conserved hypothetical protein [Ricinus communis]|uniref:Uncharacterized protein n=1 Tax=Ricinus communis TaxID=3988 RepID=B9S0N9_RICCO|nr:conserved hypothetical protein [Ricinus communis]
MSVFSIPAGLCEDIEHMTNAYWWNSSIDKKSGIRWKSWDFLCNHKSIGGLGFKKLHEFNGPPGRPKMEVIKA